MLPDKPIMLRWRQSDKSTTCMNTSPISSAKSGMGSFSVSLPKNAESLKGASPALGGPKFINSTAAGPPRRTISQKSKEKRLKATSPKNRVVTSKKAQDKRIRPQRSAVRTPSDVLEPFKDPGLQGVTRYPSPLDRYFFKATPFPFTSLDSLNTGHYTNYCKRSYWSSRFKTTR